MVFGFGHDENRRSIFNIQYPWYPCDDMDGHALISKREEKKTEYVQVDALHHTITGHFVHVNRFLIEK